ncbi:RagB/SusD family nutrient uptake outer membrane protein [Prevotella sp. kh1p2]|uniref:RagB/SusD family nutrient uptake outer membrane protein n=1 Tax=Prevotella sp. kh1p2 TaxID=1761883 RepID=UPI000B8954DF|nr:RagB/SusD family nutrient uptake outer membrane protein [Prevotella sp. kh1p2]
MKKILMLIAGTGLIASSMLTSCNYLDVDHYFEATFKEDSIFHSQVNAEGYLWNTPQGFPDPGNIWGNSWNPGETASDEITVKWQTAEFWGARLTVGGINENNVPNWYLWYDMYKIINRCNRMLLNVDNVGDMTDSDRRLYKSYVHFMRGYAYYHLLMNWGPIINVGDEVMPTDKPADFYNLERRTYDESVDYICQEFAEALKGLPMPQQQSMNYFERPTKGAALALIARLRLFQASPLFNGGTAARRCFGDWKRKSDGKDYVNQTPDPARWAVAAAAVKQVIDMDYYSLYTVAKSKEAPYPLDESVPTVDFPNGAGNIDPFHSFADMFNGEGIPKVNKEIIWGVERSNGVTGYTRHSFPVKYQGWGGMSVPQRVVDCFLMKDGKTVQESPLYDGNLENTTARTENLGDYVLMQGVPRMYANRSARFYASIGFPGRYWQMNTASADKQYVNKQFWYSNDDAEAGKAGAGNNPNDYCITGYVPVKYIHPDDSYSKANGSAVIAKPFAIIRYAEVLLEFVEAMNNVTAATTVQTYDITGNLVDVSIRRDEDLMRSYFNQIRYRVGLPGVEDAVLADRDAFDKVIKNERQVELFNEGYRYFDTRRWGTFLEEDARSSNWRGLDVNRDRDNTNGNGGFWNLVQINEQNIRDRVAKPQMVFLPLSHSELLKVPNMDQNKGWDR